MFLKYYKEIWSSNTCAPYTINNQESAHCRDCHLLQFPQWGWPDTCNLHASVDNNVLVFEQARSADCTRYYCDRTVKIQWKHYNVQRSIFVRKAIKCEIFTLSLNRRNVEHCGYSSLSHEEADWVVVVVVVVTDQPGHNR